MLILCANLQQPPEMIMLNILKEATSLNFEENLYNQTWKKLKKNFCKQTLNLFTSFYLFSTNVNKIMDNGMFINC